MKVIYKVPKPYYDLLDPTNPDHTSNTPKGSVCEGSDCNTDKSDIGQIEAIFHRFLENF